MTEQTLARMTHNKALGGRPKMVDSAMVAKAEAYITSSHWEQDGKLVPTVEALSEYLDISRQTLYEAPEFSYTLERLQRIQSDKLIQHSLSNEYNANIAKLLLASKHGYVEKTEVANTHAITAQPQEAIAQDFSAYVKGKTQAIEAEATSVIDSTTP